MGILKEKYASYDLPQQFMAKGVYPYFRCIDSEQDTEVIMNGKKVLMFGSNSYLGLTNHPKIKEAAIEAVKKYGTGCAGSRFLNGTLDIHIQLENELAEFVGKDEALVYSTGFQVNLGVLSCVTGRRDTILCDELDHASIVDGRRLSFSTVRKFRHNDMESLENELKKCAPETIKLIVVDGVFSMEGDIANMPEIVRLKNKYNASIMVDEAHGLGVLGREGRGTCDHFGVTDDVDLIMGTFSKSLATIGGFVAGDKEVMNFIRHNARSYMFSASNTPAATAAAIEALHIMKAEPERLANLWDVTNYALKNFRELGFEIGNTSTPIIPLYIRDTDKTFMVTKMLWDEGIFINPVVPPACSPQDTLIRFSLMATHTKEQVDRALDKMTKVFKALDLL
ncbi:MAG: aminotransferase class I/II-fold pyridoxal phosphate-dependent enzyme [Bacteroidaceae bacterium]|nr:aminotransferase class I/II-fold pyridoxal phosphate-dependent enzyme [Bacteroidales bacterium]MBQ3121617.1 aminotransferase class I/II-fold pyridoxal phosphate-dependent enzyme [Bacteroidaceae bacterium]MBQ4038936.1 aminotransferase class I/II-fold pyridoxal phosphate-dependent enzyme [Bacteroidaceae bacterium]